MYNLRAYYHIRPSTYHTSSNPSQYLYHLYIIYDTFANSSILSKVCLLVVSFGASGLPGLIGRVKHWKELGFTKKKISIPSLLTA